MTTFVISLTKITEQAHYCRWFDRLTTGYDASGTLQKKYVYGSGIDEPIAMISGTNTYFYNRDGLGSISELTNSTGSIIEKYQYDVYGKTIIKNASDTVITQSAYGNRFGFTGRELDNETGLYFYRARYYSPELGRFLQTDPVGYLDSNNLYQYCSNSSTNLVDPYGYMGEEVVIGAGALLPVSREALIGAAIITGAIVATIVIADAISRSKPPKCAKAVIGEDMGRVLEYIAKHPGERYESFHVPRALLATLKPLPKKFGESVLMYLNKRWIDKKMAEQKVIVNIGESIKRRQEGQGVSSFYAMELSRTSGYYNRVDDIQP